MIRGRRVILLVLITIPILGLMVRAQDFTQQLNSFVGQKLILTSYWQEQNVVVKRSNMNRATGTCDKAVEVLKATQNKDKVVFQLEQIGDIRHPFDLQPSEELGPITKPGGGITAAKPLLR